MKLKNNNQIFGELEAQIMETVWNIGEGSVREVLAKLSKKRKIAYTTVMTVMSRLHEKRILERSLDSGGAYIYSPRQTREKFFATSSKQLISNLLDNFGDVAVAQFIDILESKDSKELAAYRKKLDKLLK